MCNASFHHSICQLLLNYSDTVLPNLSLERACVGLGETPVGSAFG